VICRDCEKVLKGGFKQSEGVFLCAKCVIREVETKSTMYAIVNSLTILNELLKPGYRPRKFEIEDAARWLRSIAAIHPSKEAP